MPKVSVLIPAFRPQYLDTCLASIFAQTFTDYEILIGDDSDGGDVEAVVAKWADPRVHYERNPRRRQPGANRDFLLGRAGGKYLKFVFDDDFLLPRSLEFLTSAADQSGAKLVFHARHIVDSAGRVLASMSPVPNGQVAGVPASYLFPTMVGGRFNFIGEPSNVLIAADALRAIDNAFGLEHMRMRFLGDVALYVNVSHRGLPVVGIGAFLSAFRQHGTQTSSSTGASFSAGHFEWELFARWCTDQGHLSTEAGRVAVRLSHEAYGPYVHELPELASFVALGAEPDGDGRFMTPEFVAALEAGWEAVDRRSLAGVAA